MTTFRPKVRDDLVVCEFGSDHGVHGICWRILSKNLHLIHSLGT